MVIAWPSSSLFSNISNLDETRPSPKKYRNAKAIPAIAYKQNFDLNKTNEIHCHSWKEHVEISKITKFGCELL